MLADTPEHRGTWEAFQIVSQQLEAAEAAQEDALLIAELEDELYILYTKLSQAARGFPLPLIQHLTVALAHELKIICSL